MDLQPEQTFRPNRLWRLPFLGLHDYALPRTIDEWFGGMTTVAEHRIAPAAEAGTRAIGVGYAEKLNLAFDAESCRLAMLWHGGFIDAARHWSARGAGFEKPLGDKVLHLPPGPAIAIPS